MRQALRGITLLAKHSHHRREGPGFFARQPRARMTEQEIEQDRNCHYDLQSSIGEAMSTADSIVLRPWTRADIDSLVRYANNRKVWINLRDLFPHPYPRAGAEKWIEHCESEASKPANFAIELSGEAIGGVGVRLLDDVHRLTAEIGYWVGEPFWGKGIATEALKPTTR